MAGFPSPQVRPTRERPYAKTIPTPEQTLRRLCADSRRRQHPALDAGGRDGGGEGIRQHALVDWCVAAVVGEQPAAIAMPPPQLAQVVENRLWQWHQPLFVALTNDAQHLIGPVDSAYLQRDDLADAQTAGIHDGEASFVDRVADAAEQLPDLIL
jgi:hypothetical protein